MLPSPSRFSRCLQKSHTQCWLRSNTQRPRTTTVVAPSLANRLHRSSTTASRDGSDRRGPDDNDPPTRRRDIFPGIKRIILVRHGESLGNVNERAYVTTADWRIPLTERGREQGRSAGREVASQLRDGPPTTGRNGVDSEEERRNDVVEPSGGRGEGSDITKGKIFFYVSPYLRTRQTLREILCEIDPKCIVGIREDPRIAEQQFGNFQSHHSIQDNKATRSDFGRFFFRFPDGGESGFDVYNRVSGFIGTLQRDSSQLMDHVGPPSSSDNAAVTICIITHGLALRLLLMRWFQYTVHEFERSYNPANGRVVVLNPSPNGGFDLSEADRIDLGFPLYWEQERFRLMDDHDLLDKSDW